MQKIFKRTIAVFMVVLMMLSAVPLSCFADADWSFFKAAAAEEETAIDWSYDEATGTLTISGEGAMPDYELIEDPMSTTAPWFSYASDITKVVIEEGITTLGAFSFALCENLSELVWPEGITSIGDYAFAYCESLTEVTLPSTLANISLGAFGLCGFRYITIPVSVTNIGAVAFYSETLVAVCYEGTQEQWDEININVENDNLLTGVYFSTSEIATEGYYTYIVNAERTEATIVMVDEAISGDVVIPDTLGGFSVTKIGNSVFNDYDGLTSVIIPDTVKSIGDLAFAFCSNLKSVTLSKSLTEIAYATFGECRALTSVVIPDGVTTIGDSAFAYCNSLTNTEIPDSVTTIGEMAFYECSSFTSLTIPDSVTTIGEGAFACCYALVCDIYISENLTSIGNGIFTYSNITSINVDKDNPNYSSDAYGVLFNKDQTTLLRYPVGNERTTYRIAENVTGINANALRGCYNLTSISVEGNNPNYASDANGILYNKDKTKLYCYPAGNESNSLTVPDGVKEIYAWAFYNCYNLEYVTFPDSVESLGDSVFYGCHNLKSVTNLPNISSQMFSDCYNLESITIPEGTEYIPSSAFINCTSLTEVTIPSSVTSIFGAAFYNCTKLKDVYFGGTEAQWNNVEIFGSNECLTNATIHFSENPDSNIDWSFDEATGTLTISGEGAMPDYEDPETVPWFSYDIKKVVIEEGVTTVGAATFGLCDNLTEVVLPEGITSIGDGAFCYCVSLTDITLPETLISIGGSAFAGCIKLSELKLPDSIEHIGDEALALTAIEALSIPTGLKTVDGAPFTMMYRLEKIGISENVDCDLTGAFLYNLAVTQLNNNSLTAVANNNYGGYVFDDVKYAKVFSEFLAASYLYSMLENGIELSYVTEEYLINRTIDSTNELLDTSYNPADYSSVSDIYNEVMNNVLVPHIVQDEYPPYYNVVCLYTNSAQHNYCVENEIKHTSFISIFIEGEGAEPCNCRNIDWSYDEATKTLTVSGEGAMPDYYPEVNDNYDMITTAPWSQYANEIEKVVIEDGVTTVGTFAFISCVNIKEVVLPESIKEIRQGSFYQCISLTDINLPTGLELIREEAFFYNAIERLVIPEGVKLEEYAFYYIYGLKEVIISEGVEFEAPIDLTAIALENIENYSDSAVVVIDFDGMIINDTEWADAYVYFETALFKGMTGVITQSEAIEEICAYLNEKFGTSLVASDYADLEVFSEALEPLFVPHMVEGKYPSHLNMYCLDESAQHDYCLESCMPHTVIGEEEQCECLHPGIWTVVTQRTCTQDGKEEKTCEKCGEVFERILEAPGHDYKAVVTEETCTEDGYTTYTCSVCGDTYTDDIVPATGHAFSDWTVTQEATCTDTGTEKRSCANCGLTETNTIAAHGHDYSAEWTIDKNATCTEDGSKSHHCNNCSAKSDVTVIPATGHAYVDHEAREATCTAYGWDAYQTCENCSYSTYKRINALGHDYSEEWTIDKNATCTAAGSKSHHCIRCDAKSNITTIPAAGHSYGDWTVTREATCTASGTEKRTCSVCSVSETQTIPSLGHDYSTEWTIDRAATCTTNGSKSRHCTRCSAKTEVTVITAPGHSYSDWTVTREATCTSTGTKTRTCSVCSNSETQTIPALEHYYITDWIIEKEATVLADGLKVKVCYNCGYRNTEKIDRINVDGDENYGIANFTVVNAQTLAPLKGASIYISTENDGENTFYTDEEGKVSVVLPVGQQQITAYMSGCKVRTFKINVVHGETDVPAIGLSSKSTVDGTITQKVMTIEEIEDAGIDMEAIGNQHVVRNDVTILFDEVVPPITIKTYTAGGNVVGIADTPTHTVVKGEGYYSRPGPAGGYYYYRPAFGDQPSITIQPVSERCYMVIRGETRWLKEMFDVELLVINNSSTDTLENLQATLTLPEGLSLADMVGGSQSLVQDMGTINGSSSKSVHWYVRGDKEGSYDLSAQLTGTIMPLGEEINDTYTCKDQLKVYAGSALHLHYELPDTAYYGQDYPIKVTLTNVSDRTLYNVSHIVKEVEQGKIVYLPNGETEEYVYGTDSDSSWYEFVEEFKPGDKIVIELSVSVLFGSNYVTDKFEDIFGEHSDDIAMCYDAVSTAIVATSQFVNIISDAAAVAGEAGVSKGAAELLGRIDELTSNGYKVFTAVPLYSDSDLLKKLDTFADDASQVDVDELIPELNALKYTLESEVTQKEINSFDAFDALRTVLLSIPVKYVLSQVIFSEDESSTTSIPVSCTIVDSDSGRSGVVNVNSYLNSVIKTVANVTGTEINSSDLQLIPNVDKAETNTYKTGSATAIQGEKEQFDVKGASEDTEFTVYYVPNDLNSDYTIECDNETAEYKDGVLTFTGDGTVSLICPGVNGGTLYIQDSDGNTYSFVIDVVGQHECRAGDPEIILPPSGSFPGLAVRKCEICGDVMATGKAIDTDCDDHTFGEWETVTEATCTSSGINKRECEKCGYTETAFTAPSHIDEDQNNVCDVCGASLSGAEDPDDHVAGDINGDGAVNNKDLNRLMRYLAGDSVEVNEAALDVNGDSAINNKDLNRLMRYLAGDQVEIY